MKCIVFVVLFCLCAYLETAVAGRDLDRPLQKSAGRDNIPDDVKGKVFLEYLALLPIELKVMVLEKLSAKELYDFTQVNELSIYHELAIEAYGKSYGNIQVHFKDGNGTDFIYRKNPSGISFSNVTTFLNHLITFNRYIKNVHINFALMTPDEIHSVLSEIGRSTASTMTRLEIHFDTHKTNAIEMIKRMSFPNVEELSFHLCSFKNPVTNLSTVFPKLRRLASTLSKSANRDWIEYNFSNLTHLQIQEDERRYATQTEVLNILRNNPNIHSLSVVSPTPGLMHRINEEFPKIVNLGFISLKDVWFNNPSIHMKNIERIVFEGEIRNENTGFLTFDNLKEIQWYSPNKAEQFLLKLIANHKHTIEILQIAQTEINDHDLSRIENMEQLKKVGFWKANVTSYGVHKFIESNKELTEIRIFDAQQQLQFDVDQAIKGGGFPGWSQSNNGKDIILIKNTSKGETWGNTLFFLWDNFYIDWEIASYFL